MFSPPITQGIEVKTFADVEKTPEYSMFKDTITLIEGLYRVDIKNEEQQNAFINECMNYIQAHPDEIPHLVKILQNYADNRPYHRKFVTKIFTTLFNVFPESAALVDQIVCPPESLFSILMYEKLIPGEQAGTCDPSIIETAYTIYSTETAIYTTFIDDPTNDLYQILTQEDGRFYVKEDTPIYKVNADTNPTFLEVAAFFGATKCFKYLIQNGNEITDELPYYAIAGGNQEIIEYLKNNGCSFDSPECLDTSIMFHRYELMEWIYSITPEKHIVPNIPFNAQNYRVFFFSLYNGGTIPEDFPFLHLAIRSSCLRMVQYIDKWNHYDFLDEIDDDDLPTLHFAIQNGQLAMIKFILEEKDFDIEETATDLEILPLQSACITGTDEIVKYLVEEQKCDVNEGSPSPLLLAATNAKYEIMKYLIEIHHLDPNQTNDPGLNCLHLACKKGALKNVQYLIEHNLCDKEKKSGEGLSPLMIAAAMNHLEVLKYLHQVQKCDPLTTDQNQNIPPVLASILGHTKIVEYYVKNQIVSVNYQNKLAGYTFLHFAVQKPENDDLVCFLTEQEGSDLNIQGIDGNTPLHVAVLKCGEDIENIKTLVEDGANLEIKNGEGVTPLVIAYALNKGQAFLYLLKQGANVNETLPDGYTLLGHSCKNGLLDNVKLFCQLDSINIELGGPDGLTPFLIAITQGDIVIVQYLCENTNCNKHVRTKKGYSPLAVAIQFHHFSIVFYLLQIQHFDKNERSPGDGLTLLHFAVIARSLEIVQYLVEQEHLDVNALDNLGNSPLFYASNIGAKDIVEYLLQNKASTNIRGQSQPPNFVICQSQSADKNLIPAIEALFKKYRQ